MAQLASCALAGDPRLRTPDAIRVAAAASLREELEPLVTYDGRMLLAAEAMAPPVASPAPTLQADATTVQGITRRPVTRPAAT